MIGTWWLIVDDDGDVDGSERCKEKGESEERER